MEEGFENIIINSTMKYFLTGLWTTFVVSILLNPSLPIGHILTQRMSLSIVSIILVKFLSLVSLIFPFIFPAIYLAIKKEPITFRPLALMWLGGVTAFGLTAIITLVGMSVANL